MSDAAIRVFLVDDHPLVRDWLKALLQTEPGFEVTGEADEQAAALAAMSADPPDVAVVDLSLRRGSGMELIKALRARLPAVRVLVLSMHEEIRDVERALRAGARGYVMKGASSGQIVPAIRWVHSGKIYATPEVFSRLAERLTQAAGDEIDHVDRLSDRELEVFRRLGEGQTTRRIADELYVSQKTVQTYCARIKEKIGLDDGAELTLAAIRWCGLNRE
ncbi:response regulator [Piscinibacter koreensis]|uniref:Response regulator transcription factor n=1 Tax=Piscinibacter koreensis TaxID=2742824 RepID=A0A7Y6TXQ8_9BURK|nr:response regulator transcription factor [Schlegelella koreensis]